MSYESESGFVRSRRKWLFAVTASWFLGGMLPVTAAFAGGGLSMSMWTATAMVGGYMASVFGCVRLWQRWLAVERGKLQATEDGLRVNDRLVVKRSTLKHGYPLEIDGQLFVRLVERSAVLRAIDVAVSDMDAAHRLLAALRLDAASSVTEWTLLDGTYERGQRRMALAVGGLVFMSMIAAFLAFVLRPHPDNVTFVRGAALTVYLLTIMGFTLGEQAKVVTVSVGADGVRLRKLTGTRFIPFSQVDGARLEGKDIHLTLTDGSTVPLHHPSEGRKNVLYDHEHQAAKLVERITEQLAAHRSAPKVNVDVLTRAGRRAEEWLRDARALTERNATFRTPAVPHEELWRIVEDAAAEPTARAGAALALRSELDEASRTRLRIAADACAAPQLRVALESVAREHDDEDELLRALEPLEDRRLSLRR